MPSRYTTFFAFVGLLFTPFLASSPLILLKGYGGQIHWSNYSGCVGGGIEYHFQKVAFDLSISYQSYDFSVPQNEVPPPFDTISYCGLYQELLTGLGIKYTIFNYKEFRVSLLPKVILLLSGGEIKSDATIPGELDDKYGCNKFFLSVNPGIGIHYNIPKTNLWVGTEFNYTHHFNYTKAQNNYFALIYSFAFELFRR
uniref:Outer membrane protein beta-barrel domain-containing protein n=1 Tax=candidate division WOR-3 bacterium TaxID=2052148 RepID=A0A7C4TF60_UNCW3